MKHISFKRKSYIFLFLIICFSCGVAHAQTVRGTIIDRTTNSPIPFATVYFSRTTLGTIADKNGSFEIKTPGSSSMPLIFSALGYYSYTLTDFSTDMQYLIHLTPKVFELEEVVITAKADERARKAKLKIFRREFLGRTLNARSCEILNEEDIILTYTPGKDTLKGFSHDPVNIYNGALGYNIEFFLDKFEFCNINNRLSLIGNYIFSPDTLASDEQISVFEEKREKAYLGSRMHFFRALWNNELDAEGFTVKDETGAELSYDDLVFIKDSLKQGGPEKYLKYRDTLHVYYRKRWFRILYGSFYMNNGYEYVYFEKNGYFDTLGLIWKDSIMAHRRIADLLPFDYTLTDKNDR